MFTSRSGALTLGVGAALLAALLLLVYLRAYRNSVRSDAEPASVLVAKSLIPKGTPGSLIAKKGLYQVTRIPKDQLKDGAVADPAAIRGQVAAADVYPGQQFTIGDFAFQSSNSLPAQITGPDRAIAVSVDGTHGLVGQLATGDHVDVYVSLGGQAAGQGALLKLLAADIVVLAVPSGGGSSGASNVVLRVPAGRAPDFALADDTGKIWLTLRPQAEATPTPRLSVSVATLLAAR